jgi:hypothetical protein
MPPLDLHTSKHLLLLLVLVSVLLLLLDRTAELSGPFHSTTAS